MFVHIDVIVLKALSILFPIVFLAGLSYTLYQNLNKYFLEVNNATSFKRDSVNIIRKKLFVNWIYINAGIGVLLIIVYYFMKLIIL
ncbi:hypothetical protein COL60_27025 [Bacillus pseudomycoides]|uniref:hypothetical protein n=1 Tax=Bacillus pseudomycoides TaxID=64104 RepID=UPI000BF8FC62|nr:hypothetical protein [Bacillus pseudomycoides]PFZ02735.1 hypothetical protein COL60_27025 [Bacillus pseudomycoides]